jgi:hypothetical protein
MSAVTLENCIPSRALDEPLECNIFDWLDSLIGPGELLLVPSLPPICSPNFSFMGGIGKKVNN